MSRREVFENVKHATVAIAALNVEGAHHPFSIIGSGFCVDKSGVVVTCRHVVEFFMQTPILDQIKNTTGKKSPDGGELLPPTRLLEMYAVFYQPLPNSRLMALLAKVTHVVCKTDDFDLAALRINPDQPAFPNGYPYLEVEQPDAVNEGDEIATCGFPHGTYLHDQLGTVTSSFTKGIVSSIIPAPGAARDLIKGFQLNLDVTYGNSGGPVFSVETGRVFGVIEAGFDHLIKATPIYPIINGDTVEGLKKAPFGSVPGPIDHPITEPAHSNSENQ